MQSLMLLEMFHHVLVCSKSEARRVDNNAAASQVCAVIDNVRTRVKLTYSAVRFALAISRVNQSIFNKKGRIEIINEEHAFHRGIETIVERH